MSGNPMFKKNVVSVFIGTEKKRRFSSPNVLTCDVFSVSEEEKVSERRNSPRRSPLFHTLFLSFSFFPTLTPSLSLAELKIGAGGRELEKE